MSRHLAFVIAYSAGLMLLTATSVPAAQFGTAEEAKAMLEKAVTAVKEDKAKAVDMFNKGEGGFKDRDLYVFCAASKSAFDPKRTNGLGFTSVDFLS